MGTVNKITVTFELSNGLELQATWNEFVDEATFDDPEESECSEPEYELDGKPVSKFPKGLDTIADKMYSDPESDPRFKVETLRLGRLPYRCVT